MHHSHGRATLGGKLSAVLVAAGSSVGLGNIWRFPYVAGDNGGGAFLVIYILCVLLLGLPHHGGRILGRTRLAPQCRGRLPDARAAEWSFLGYNGVAGGIPDPGLLFRGVGMDRRIHGSLRSRARLARVHYRRRIQKRSSRPSCRTRGSPLLYTVVCSCWRRTSSSRWACRKGIERSAKMLMPLLFVDPDRTVGPLAADARRRSGA